MRAWCPPGIRLVANNQILREYVYAYAAVAPELGKMTALVLLYANTQMMNLFLAQVSREFKDCFLVMQVDGASWHCCRDLVVSENIRLALQPSHSPELNPVEHLWEEIKEKHFYNKVFESMDAVIENLCNGLNELMIAPKPLQSLTKFSHLRVKS